MPYISVKLPVNIVTVYLPAYTTTAQVTDAVGSTRITRGANVRVTRGGNIRVTHYRVTAYPELMAIKLDNGIVSLPVEDGKRTL